jgi:hypothetical protein
MLMTIAIVLAVLWFLGLIAVHITSPLLHLILIIALVVFIYDLVVRGRGRGPTAV